MGMESMEHPDQLEPPTPSFVIDVPSLEFFVGRFEQALTTHWPNSILSYSFKTNSLPWLLSFMRERGVWAEVVSDTEYELALAVGYPPDRIIFNGPIKSRSRLISSLKEGSIVNLDAKREVWWTAELARESPEMKLKVGLRVNWNLEAECPGESTTGEEGSRFGFNAETGELDAAITELQSAGVEITGLHMHRNSSTQSVGVYRAAATVAAQLIASRNLELDWIDIGGGFFGSVAGTPNFEDYIATIRAALEPVIDPEKTCLIVEPGGSLIAIPVEFHSTVVDAKETDSGNFVVTDGSRTNIDPLFRRRRPFEYSLSSSATDTLPEQIISGFTCMEDDRLMTLENAPALEAGDRLVFHKVGAYTMCYQSMFIHYLPAVFTRTETTLTQVRQPWGVEEFLQGNAWAGDHRMGHRTHAH